MPYHPTVVITVPLYIDIDIHIHINIHTHKHVHVYVHRQRHAHMHAHIYKAFFFLMTPIIYWCPGKRTLFNTQFLMLLLPDCAVRIDSALRKYLKLWHGGWHPKLLLRTRCHYGREKDTPNSCRATSKFLQPCTVISLDSS